MSEMIGQIECEHLGRRIYPTECTLCSGAFKKLQKDQARSPRIFPAKWPGQCPGCDLPISIGDMIAWTEGGGPVSHASCV